MGKKGKKQKKKKDKAERKERRTKAAEAKSDRKQKKQALDDIDAIFSQLKVADEKHTQVVTQACEPPSPRCNGTLVAHPTENKVFLYGGEYFDGKTTKTFADLFMCNLSNMSFKSIVSPNRPLPRNSHQAVMVARQGGQMWMFGGEFTSPKGEFRHYKDLWVLEMKTMTWTEIRAKGAPSARSGHRMVATPTQLIVFGGFYDNGQHITQYNDLHVFDLPTMKWSEVKPSNVSARVPPPRAGHQFMVHAKSNTALLYGGIRMETRAKGNKSTHYFSDIWKLNLTTMTWNKIKAKGQGPSPRAGMTMSLHHERAVFFGGVSDQESELDYESTCHNDLFSLALGSGAWHPLTCRNGQSPPPRRHAQMVVKGNNLIVFGGVLEQKNKEITLNDWHSLDLKKLDTWKTMVDMDISTQEWFGSDVEDEPEEEDSEPEPEVEEEEPEIELEDVRPDEPLSTENVREFFSRSKEFWMKAAQAESEGLAGKELRKRAFVLARERFEEYE